MDSVNSHNMPPEGPGSDSRVGQERIDLDPAQRIGGGIARAGQFVHVHVLGAVPGQDLDRPALVRLVAHVDPEQQAAVVELRLQRLRPVAAQKARRPAADQAAATAGDRGRGDGGGERAAGGDHSAGPTIAPMYARPPITPVRPSASEWLPA